MAATVWKGYLSFGLVSFPIRLAAAARAEAVHFHMLHRKDGSRVKEVWYCAKENKPIDRSEMVKGFERAKGKYVVVEEEELKKAAPPTATTMEIVQFVKAGELDPIYFEKSYYVSPEAAATKPYALLRRAMMDMEYYAVAKVAMHAREHVVILRADENGLVLHTMYFANELHAANKVKGLGGAKFSAKEMNLAKQLINSLAGSFRPEQFRDEYRENVERLIRQKSKGKEVAEVEQPKAKPVVDILDALRQSLAASHSQSGKRARKAA